MAMPSRAARGKPARKAFMLTELLVVMGIVAVLAAMLMPVLAAAQEVARRTTCMSNLCRLAWRC